VLSTFGFIKQGEYKDSLAITKILLNDQHDLIHKASGWMLREIGKRDKHVLVNFLNKHCETMPRTMLRYAIEKFNDRERSYYMKQQRKLPIDRV
jgi:3-methyladenine DNA glycosylase AlkD